MIDEGPSAEDIARFSDDTGYCPDCGAPISDLSEFCPACGAAVSGRVSSRPPEEQWYLNRWRQMIIALVLIAFVLLFVFVL